MKKLGKRILSLLIVAVLVCTMLPISASALSGSYGNGTWSDVEGSFYIMKPDGTQEQVTGWKTTITNPRQTFTLWFPNPYYYGSTFSGYHRFTAGEHGTGSYSETATLTYYVSTDNLGYELHLLPTVEKLEQNGIVADTGYKFSHYEITYWNRDSSSSAFTKRTERFDPNDIMPFDINLRGKYAQTRGYLDIKVIFVEDETANVTYTLSYNANGGVNAPDPQTETNNTGSATFTVTSEKPTREGYNFLGWADTDDALTASYLAGDTVKLTKDTPSKTLYAVWAEIPAPENTYTLRYDANGGEGAPALQTDKSSADSYDFIISDVTPTREGYNFLGWADDAKATAAQYHAGETITLTKDTLNKTIFAVWEKKTGEKVSKPGITKEEDKSNLGGGETVSYILTSNVPDYLGDYLTLPTPGDPVIVNAAGDVTRGSYPLTIYDKLPAGLTFNESTLSVTIGTTVLPTDAYTLTVGTANDDFSFCVELDLVKLYEKGYFTMEQIKNAEKIYVKYSATLAKDAAPAHYLNAAWVGFEGGLSEKVYANVKTFGIEVFKYDQSTRAGLDDAVFELTDANGKVWTAESENGGIVTFNALAAGTYTLKELKAPTGYVKSDKPLKIEIKDGDNVPLVIKTEFANVAIPHTGGEGTTMFFVLGGTLTGVAIALYMASQKKRSFQA